MTETEYARINAERYQRKRKRAVLGQVYFITDGEFIKIGFSTNPEDRLRSIQTGYSRPLSLLGVIHHQTQHDERIYHVAFKESRVRGEWFRFDEKIVNHLRKIEARQNTPREVAARARARRQFDHVERDRKAGYD